MTDSELNPGGVRTITQHIMEQQRVHPSATGDFSLLLGGLMLATRMISSSVRRAGISGVLGSTGDINVQGEVVQKLDELADKNIRRCMQYRHSVGIMASEEIADPIVVEHHDGAGKYIVIYDPLDGSSNIDVDVSVGTIFSVLQRTTSDNSQAAVLKDVLQPGVKQIAAGYVIYGSSTVAVYTTGAGVHMFTLDPMIGAYILAGENLRMPEDGKMYSTNEANLESYPEGIKKYLAWAKTTEAGPFTSRYIGSLVADFHRTLLKGGVFIYPSTAKAPKGKLRLMCEANPMAFIAEQAGGMASDGRMRILEKQPAELHERTPLIIGSTTEVQRLLDFCK
jgi:fructose-1,6-bisphosphatase I